MKPMTNRTLPLAAGLLWLSMTTAWGAPESQATKVNPDTPPFQLCAAEQVLYDSNLFRLTDSMDVHDRLGANASKNDYIYRTSACANGDWQLSRQELQLSAEIADNRFKRNSELNNTSTNGKINWNWNLADNWSGKLGGTVTRALGAFYNDRPIEKDIVTSYEYFGELKHIFGAHVGIFADAERVSSTHSAADRGVDEFHSNSGKLGAEYITSAQDTIGVDYQYTRADYPGEYILAGVPFVRDYNQNITSLRVNYALGAKTQLNASLGYLERTYPQAHEHDYSGDEWRVSLQYQPTVKTQLQLTGWHELSAYLDSESDHFLSQGVSLIPSWSPRRKIGISALLWWEKQNYLSSSLAAITEGPREDKVKTAGANLTYSPVKYLDVLFSYRHEQHDSNHADLSFNDNLATITLKGKFP